jgi:protein tyrosine/serine phosphatase
MSDAESATRDWADAKTGGRITRSRPVARLIRCLKVAGASVGLMAAAIGGYWGVLQYEGNLHAVSAGTLYRSAQLSKTDARWAVREYRIKSVLNLRGAHAGQSWYDDEIAAADELGLAHFDYPLSAKRFVTSQQIDEILDIVRKAPKPLLIHCKSGADRSGLVAALYRFSEAGASAVEADRELSLIYGHFPYLTSRSGAMDDSFWAFVHGKERASVR